MIRYWVTAVNGVGQGDGKYSFSEIVFKDLGQLARDYASIRVSHDGDLLGLGGENERVPDGLGVLNRIFAPDYIMLLRIVVDVMQVGVHDQDAEIHCARLFDKWNLSAFLLILY